MRTRDLIVTVVSVAACGGGALADSPFSVFGTSSAQEQSAPAGEVAPSLGRAAADGAGGGPAALEFGQTGSRWIGLGFGAASNGDFTDLNLYGRYEYFVAPDIELIGELGIWNYQQEGKDATGFNPALVIRYHFLHREKWTMFIDGGIGLLFSTDPVNRTDGDEGSSFNFTPRVGGGFTRELAEDVRLEVGLRWAHVSNARISGNNDNPGRDSLMLYAGLIFPF